MIDRLLTKFSEFVASLPKNKFLWSYTINGRDNSPYLTRILFPRLFGFRLMLHKFHRPDEDKDLHNHPWKISASLILSGGYIEEKDGNRGLVVRTIKPGSLNIIRGQDFHRVIMLMGPCWTLFLAGPRTQGWGFRDKDTQEFIDWETYLRRKGVEV